MRYAFTASRKLSPADAYAQTIEPVLRELRDGAEFVTGAQYGGDSVIARALAHLYPDARHRIVLPAAPHNEEIVDQVALALNRAAGRPEEATPLNLDVLHAAERSTKAASYRERNSLMLALSDTLVSFPLHEEPRMPYSGTWAVTREAERRGMPLVGPHLLDPRGGDVRGKPRRRRKG